ncbi:pimeloyl-ACP methyl ester carboxylesterase [Nonomuraea polychroma]|uniref:Pimeloyl-ACP methyl ester carboxylesterase n=1 Tax=Nonomuraea polychroma TaxID=46176 RepID=A0A438ME14_9ACTN|nr:alpha/beta hydrolase [Nonomuraea polychroma]RVX44050.1 pimeloyl-ACP methyl ester carboxylesterase [Nonomuraea polychroma]
MRATANGIDIAYETFGSPAGRPLLLIMGLGAQLIHWNEEFCRLLAEQGHHVVRFDNRDAGLSTHFHDKGVPEAGAPAPYLLDDLADDAACLMDALAWPAAHVVGASMGGMIAQTLAIRHPERVLTLTSIMSTPGTEVAPPTAEALAVLMATPPADRDGVLEQALRTWSVIGSPGYELDREWITTLAGTAYDRCFDPAGTARQLAAIMASGSRTESLTQVKAPTLVLHGEADPLVPVAGGQATAAAVPGARLVTYPGMGHDLPRALWPDIATEITKLTSA